MRGVASAVQAVVLGAMTPILVLAIAGSALAHVPGGSTSGSSSSEPEITATASQIGDGSGTVQEPGRSTPARGRNDDATSPGAGGQSPACSVSRASPPDGSVSPKVVDGVSYYWMPRARLVADGCFDVYGEWVPKLTAQALAPDVTDSVRRRLVTPPVQFQRLDPVHGWWYVNVPMDFRLGVVEPVTATASASNELGTAWITVTATPTLVTFTPGEPDGVPVRCSLVGAAAPYVAERPGSARTRTGTRRRSRRTGGRSTRRRR